MGCCMLAKVEEDFLQYTDRIEFVENLAYRESFESKEINSSSSIVMFDTKTCNYMGSNDDRITVFDSSYKTSTD